LKDKSKYNFIYQLKHNWKYNLTFWDKAYSWWLSLFYAKDYYQLFVDENWNIPVWPVAPTPYVGAKIGEKKGDLVIKGGFGNPSAGMLKISEGTKSFGVLGQEKPNYNPGKDK